MKTTKAKETALARLLIAGTQKHFLAAGTLAFGNRSFTPAQVQAFLQTLIDLRTAVDDSRTATQAKIAAEAAQAPSLRGQISAYVAFVKATFGNSPDALADFGLQPKKATAPLTLDQKAAAAAKRAATRKVRHTMGTKQKSELKGTITTIVTDTPAPATPPVAPSPVANAPPTQGTPSAGTAPHAAS